MRILLAIILVLYAPPITTEQMPDNSYIFVLGAPCSTTADRRELANKNGICINPVIKSKPTWARRN
jgi:hypothetical protein